MLLRRFESVILLLALAATATAQGTYSGAYDHVDVIAILNDNVMREQYYNCFMNAAPCPTADAKFFQGIMSEAAVTNCQKCTDKQKQNFAAIADWFTRNQPAKWDAFIKKAMADAARAGIR